MKTKDVAKLPPTERFLYWIRERHDIYLRCKAGKPKPWTDDEVLQSYFFTNPYREHDKTTVWFRENVREPLRNDLAVLMATIIFRWFNLISTGIHLKDYALLTRWNQRKALYGLNKIREMKRPIFTGAFMINSPGGEPKLEAICRRVNNVWLDRRRLNNLAQGWVTLQQAHGDFVGYEGLGGFMAYEIVCDLRYTFLLEGASDKESWCNPGSGCIRGLYRIAGEEIVNKSNATSPPKPKDWLDRMRKLLETTQCTLSDMPRFEMREIEHSLCEFDKYERARLGDGKLKRKYRGAR